MSESDPLTIKEIKDILENVGYVDFLEIDFLLTKLTQAKEAFENIKGADYSEATYIADKALKDIWGE